MTPNETVFVPANPVDDAGIEVAILDFSGEIVSVNGAWERFRGSNAGDPGLTGVGVNYLEVCDRAGDDPGAVEVASAIRRALAGDLASAEVIEIACHSPAEHRWFDVLVSSRGDNEGDIAGATVVLIPVTSRTEARNTASRDTGTGS